MSYRFHLVPTSRSYGYMSDGQTVRVARFLTLGEAKFEASFVGVREARSRGGE